MKSDMTVEDALLAINLPTGNVTRLATSFKKKAAI
jgi:hypothetical protein